RGDAGGARGGHRGQARRPGQGEGRGRRVEGPDGQRELDGRQPHFPGAQHRRRDDRGGEGRPVEEDRGGREGRVPDPQVHHQHDGGPAALLRRGGDARRARGGHGGNSRRPGAGRGRVGHVEGPDRLGELDGRQPHLAGEENRRRDQGGGGGRPVAQDHGGREGRGAGAEIHHQHDG